MFERARKTLYYRGASSLKILIVSPAFYPQIGGVEEIARILAEQFVLKGCQVKVVCSVLSNEPDIFPFEVIRRPSPIEYLKAVQWANVFFQQSMALKWIWPLLFIRRPWFVVHHSVYQRAEGLIGWQDWLKRKMLCYAKCISISHYVASRLPYSETIIPNAYRSKVFYKMSHADRKYDFIFVGRLVSEKGCNLILEALALLKQQGFEPSLTIVGDGPERVALESLKVKLNLNATVSFTGFKRNDELCQLLNQHKIMIIPSAYEEPFGIVALEGIACGCFIVSAYSGGLPEAVGKCGIFFKRGDIKSMAEALKTAISINHASFVNDEAREMHLSQFQPEIIAGSYLNLFLGYLNK